MNKAKLIYEMNIRGVTHTDLCRAVGISRSAFYRKCSGKSEFTQGEIQKIVDFLGLSTPVGIFFEEKVSQKTRSHCRRCDGGEGGEGDDVLAGK